MRDQRGDQQELPSTEARFREVIDALRDVVFQADVDGGWTFLNPAWPELTGYSVDESRAHVPRLRPSRRPRAD